MRHNHHSYVSRCTIVLDLSDQCFLLSLRMELHGVYMHVSVKACEDVNVRTKYVLRMHLYLYGFYAHVCIRACSHVFVCVVCACA
jgi:hypothetical protein